MKALKEIRSGYFNIKVDFRARKVLGDKEGHYVTIKEDIASRRHSKNKCGCTKQQSCKIREVKNGRT